MCPPAPPDGMRARPLVPSRALAALADATGDPLDDLEETALPGAAVLTYDGASRRYHYNWKTVKSWSGTCRELNLTFADGTTASAEFRLR